MKGSNESKDTVLPIPEHNDITAVKCQGQEFKIGIITWLQPRPAAAAHE